MLTEHGHFMCSRKLSKRTKECQDRKVVFTHFSSKLNFLAVKNKI